MVASLHRRLTCAGLTLALASACGPSKTPTEAPLPIVDEFGRVPQLICPAGPGCATARGPLRVGAATRTITPVVEPFEDLDGNGRWDPTEPYEDLDEDGEYSAVWMAGFSLGRQARSVHDDLWARALVLEQGDLQVGMVVLDTVGWFHDDVLRVREAVQALGVPLDHLVVASTHDHEAPDSMGPWGATPLESGRDEDHLSKVVAWAAEAVAEAWSKREPVTMTYAQVDLPHLVHDSRLPEVKDALATGIRFEGGGGPVAVLAVWGNHPESLDDTNQALTSDYPHYLRSALEAANPGAVALFMPGNLGGLMNPLHIEGCPDEEGNATCDNGTYEKAEYIGRGVGEALATALDGSGAVQVDAPDLRARRRSVLLTFNNVLFLAGWSGGIIDRTVFGADGRRMPRSRAEQFSVEEVEQGALRIQSEVGSVGIGPLELVTVPGELYPELWLTGPDGESLITHPEGADYPDAEAEPALSTLVPDDRLPVVINQANDAIGYLIPRPQFDREEPRAYKPNGQYGEQNSIGPDTPRALAEGLQALFGL